MRLYTGAIATTTLAMTMSACGGISGNMQPVDFSGKSVSVAGSSSPSSAALACLGSKVDYVLNTQVLDFEMQGGGGLTVGFTPSGTTLSELSIGVTYSTGELQTEMTLTDPLKPGVSIVQAGGQASEQNLSLQLDATVTLISFGPQFWYSTTISELSDNTLQSNLTNLNAQLNTLVPSSDWWTTVSQLNGNLGFFIPVGSNAGLQVGDEFNVMDVTYEWGGNGTPCSNELLMPLINSPNPKALAKVQSVAVDYAYLAFESQTQAVNLYDYVSISKLTPSTVAPVVCTNFLGIGCPSTPASTARTTLARSIRLGTITSQPLPFVGQSGVAEYVDITPFVQTQLAALLPEQQFGGFYIHQ